MAKTPCKHMRFDAGVAVNRLEDTGKFNLDVRVSCLECGLPFQFLGLEAGLNLGGAAVSLDGEEARLAIAPKGSVPTPFALLHGSPKAFN